MLTLACANPAKYQPFLCDLERLRISLEPPPQTLPELQTLSFAESLQAKARAAAALFGRPVLVDEAGLVLEAYRPFPGPLTSPVLQGLGIPGLRRLLHEVSDRATMECHLGCWIGDRLRSWSGVVPGRLDCSREVQDVRMPLSDLFLPEAADTSLLLHRAAALAALETDVFALHLDLGPEPPVGNETCAGPAAPPCPFCAELAYPVRSIFGAMMAGQLRSRVVYEDDDFVVMPPLGQFIEGGLLLLTREHLPSFACLPAGRFERLERLLAAIGRALLQHWGVAPLVFEHGPAPDRGKGVCCVDHAHFNIFPATLPLHPHLRARMHLAVGPLADLARLRRAEFGYLLVQENDGTRRAYDGQHAPTQLIRRIITAALGMPERWHWRDYPGREELKATFHALKGRISL